MTRFAPIASLSWRIALALALVLLLGFVFLATFLRSLPALLDLIDRAWPSAAVRVAHDVVYAPGGRNSLDIWAVPDARRNRPVLVFWYGGGWVGGAKEDYGFAARAFAARGFVVVVPDYRLVPQVRFPAFVQDGAAAVGWVTRNIAHYGGDPTRIVLSGHSAGAYTVALLALDPRYLQAAGVDPVVVRAAAPLSGPYDFYPYTGSAIAAMGEAAPRETQPIAFVRPDAPHMLLVTGGDDVTVGPHNARDLAAALRRVGAPATLRVYPGLGHESIVMALSHPYRGRAPVLADAADFLIRAVQNPH